MIGWILLGVLGLALLAFLLMGRGRLATGRAGRIARMGRLSARLSASWLGAKLRRLFAGKARRVRIDEARRKANAAAVARTMGEMKGAMMKLGQMVSFVSDAVPEEFRTALSTLQASAPPMDFAVLRDVAERELGKPLERAFARFDEEPLAAASIGQVHRAQLPSGEEVVVKIQYPGVGEAIRADLANAAILYQIMGMMYPALDPKPVVEELRSRIGEELDYAREAENQRVFARRYQGHPYVRIPRVFDAWSTPQVLTTEYIHGRRFAEILSDPPDRKNHWAEILYRFVFSSIISHSMFNGDPHPGNYLFCDDGHVAFLDFGCVKYFPADMMKTWRSLVTAHLDGRRDEFRQHLIDLGFIRADTDLGTDLLYEYFHFYYTPFAEDREFTFTREYNSRSLGMVFSPKGKFEGLTKKTNMPRDFVFVNRIQWGVYSILAQLGATGNWHRIHREYLHGDPPSTEIGRVVV